jgi:TfoX/Sxy family transcriptional regulator of competence genes
VAAEQRNEILDQVASLGEVTARPLFGGHGLFRRETIFGILSGAGST